ncbi:MAG: prephenate dehydrogenase [Candidatus Nanopelagicaceae bacterium]|nr:prephenate dehydrogenase [Candidatus Nanopelagicaceae bacterium]
MRQIQNLRIVGTGLIGTSIALRAGQSGMKVELADSDLSTLNLARDLLAPYLLDVQGTNLIDLVIIATPPMAAFEVLIAEFERNPKAIFIDIGSVKTNLVHKVEGLSALKQRFLGTHPMAGRESAGASAAQADLFEGRAWILTPTETTSSEIIEVVAGFVSLMGATPYQMSPYKHDEVLAYISHLPQILSTSLSATILDSQEDVSLAGQGLRDMVRIAGSDGELWSEILRENQQAVLQALEGFEGKLSELRAAILNSNNNSIVEVFKSGNMGRALVSGKHGAKPRNYEYLLIVIKDEPGALSKLFNECASIGANIEDLSIEHSPGQFTGLITLAFSPEDANKVRAHLESHDWKVHQR